jgi:hypothetical protein
MADAPPYLAVVQPAGYVPPAQIPGPAVLGLHPSSSRSRARGEIYVAIDVTAKVSATIRVTTTEVARSTVRLDTVGSSTGKRTQRVSLAWNAWEIANIGFGIAVGSVANALTGSTLGYGTSALGGAIVFYVWGLWRWRDEHR